MRAIHFCEGMVPSTFVSAERCDGNVWIGVLVQRVCVEKMQRIGRMWRREIVQPEPDLPPNAAAESRCLAICN